MLKTYLPAYPEASSPIPLSRGRGGAKINLLAPLPWERCWGEAIKQNEVWGCKAEE